MGAVIATAFFQCVHAAASGLNVETNYKTLIGGSNSGTIYQRVGNNSCEEGKEGKGDEEEKELIKVNVGKDCQVVMPLSRLSKLIMPIYFIPNAVLTQVDIKIIGKIWKLIVIGGGGSSEEGKGKRDGEKDAITVDGANTAVEEGEGYTPSARHLQRFVTIFYDRLFDIHPSAKPLFVNGTVSQGRVLIKMISMSISHLHHPEKFHKLIMSMAKHHCEYGVKCYEYGIMGEVLFYSLCFTLGNEIYNTEVDMAWKRLYSVMLSIIIPCCVQYENENRCSVGGGTGSLSLDGESKRRTGLGQCRYSGSDSEDTGRGVGSGLSGSTGDLLCSGNSPHICGVSINNGCATMSEHNKNNIFFANYHNMATEEQRFHGQMDPIGGEKSTSIFQEDHQTVN